MDGIIDYPDHGSGRLTSFDVLRQHRELVQKLYEPIEPIAAKKAIRPVEPFPRTQPVAPVTFPINEIRPWTNPFTQPLPEERPAEIKNVAEEVKKQKPNKDYLELFEE